MASSSAANPTAIRAISSGQNPMVPKKTPNSTDLHCQLGKLIALNNHNDIQCKKCHQIVQDGINKLKQHITRIKGNVRSCSGSTDE